MKNILMTGICIVSAMVIAAPPHVHAAVFDDFSDLNDTADPAWTHVSGYVNSTGQTWDASTGQYRLTAPNQEEAFLRIYQTDRGRWQAALRTTQDGPDAAVSEGTFELPTDAWDAAFELYRNHILYAPEPSEPQP